MSHDALPCKIKHEYSSLAMNKHSLGHESKTVNYSVVAKGHSRFI